MKNIILFSSCVLILIPLFLFLINRKLFYYSLIVLYPVVGQLIGTKIELFNFSINPSMLFGLLVLSMTALDFLLRPSKEPLLEIIVILFILYSLFSCIFSPIRFESISWALKIATWLLILLASIKIFVVEEDLYQIHLAVSIAVIMVIASFLLSWLGYYGESFTYETGVESIGAGFSSGKTLAYYLAISIPILALKTVTKGTVGKIFSLILIFTSTAVIFLTFVRAPVVALLVGFLSYQYFSFKYGDKSFFTTVFIILAIAVFIFSLYFFLEDSQYMSRWSEMGDKYSEGKIDKLGSGRVGGLISFFEYYFYKASVFKKIFGSGLGSSYVYLGSKKFIHNDFAEILMGCGIIGFSLYILIIVKIFDLLIKFINNSNLARSKKYGILTLCNLFIFLSFHMTNISSGVFILSVWAIQTGATIGLGQSLAAVRNSQWDELFRRKEARSQSS